MNLIATEMRRALKRRAVRVLLLLGLLGCAMAGIVSFIGSRGKPSPNFNSTAKGTPR